jgi:hypothetical protein
LGKEGRMKKVLQSIIFAFSFVLICSGTGFSMSDAELAKKFAEMEKMIQKQQVQIEKQNEVIKQLQDKTLADPVVIQPASEVVTPANREQIKSIVAELVSEETMPVPEWLKGIKFGGDLRLRYEAIYNRTDKSDRHRGRFRLRLNFAKKLSDELDVILRLASGSGRGITSSNQTFDDYYDKKDIRIDRVYALYRPNWLKGLALAGGKFPNPLVNTDIIWDSDVNPEGVYEKYVFSMTDSFKPFITLSQFFIEEVDDGSDTSLLAYQTGYNWSIAKSQWTLAATLYDFKNLGVKVDDLFGNSGEGGFNILNLTSFWKTILFGKSFNLYGDYAKNTDSEDNDYAYAFGFLIGAVKKRGDWSFGYKYARIEPDAVVGVFADSNFGGSNRYGNKFSLKYKFHPNIVFGATAWITESVSGPEDDETDIALDLIFNF